MLFQFRQSFVRLPHPENRWIRWLGSECALCFIRLYCFLGAAAFARSSVPPRSMDAYHSMRSARRLLNKIWLNSIHVFTCALMQRLLQRMAASCYSTLRHFLFSPSLRPMHWTPNWSLQCLKAPYWFLAAIRRLCNTQCMHTGRTATGSIEPNKRWKNLAEQVERLSFKKCLNFCFIFSFDKFSPKVLAQNQFKLSRHRAPSWIAVELAGRLSHRTHKGPEMRKPI